MASLYARDDSKFWWVKFRDPVTSKVKQESTGFLKDDTAQTRKAREICAQKTLAELRTPRRLESHRWALWVVPFLEQRYASAPQTLARMKTNWRTLATYLAEKAIDCPEQLHRQACLDYVPWRKTLGHLNSKGKKAINQNTVLLELKTLSSIMQEVVRREWREGNPCFRLELRGEPPRVKKEMRDSQIALVCAEIQRRLVRAVTPEEKRKADFLQVSWTIALGQAVRLSETWLPLDDVDLHTMEITFRAKGNRDYTAPLNPALVPLFERLLKEGRTHTYERPRMPSLVWFKVFDHLRKTHPEMERISFHSVRVTGVSRLERAGLQESISMKLVNHSSTTVHRVYRKVNSKDLKRFWSVMSPLASSAQPPS